MTQKRLTAIFEMKDGITGKLTKAIGQMEKFKQQADQVKSTTDKLNTTDTGQLAGGLQKVKAHMDQLADNSSMAKFANGISQAKNRISDLLKSSATLNRFRSTISNTFSGVQSKVSSAISGIVKTSSNGMKRLAQTFARSAVGKGMGDIVGSIIKGGQLIGQGFRGIQKTTSSAVDRVKQTVQHGLGGLFNKLNLGKFTPQIQKMGEGFKGFFGKIGGGFKKLLGGAGDTFRRITGMSRESSGGMGSLTGAIFKSQLAMKALGMVTQTVTAGIRGAIERVDSIKSSTKAIEVLTGSGEQAKQVMAGVTEVIQGTPIALDQVTNATKGLVASGMKVEQVPKVIEAIGNASYGVANGSESIDQITGAFKGLQSSGTASLEDLNRLVDANVPAVKILANQYGLSVADMKKKLSDGAISSEEAIEKLVEGMEKGTDGVAGKTAGLAGQMKNAGDTIKGAMGNIRTAIVRAFTEPFDMYYDQIVGWLKSVRGHIDVFANTMTEGFKRVVPAVIGFFKEISPILQEFGTGFLKYMEPTFNSFVRMLQEIGPQIIPIFEGLMGHIVAFYDAVGPIIVRLAQSFVDFIGKIMGLAPAVMEMVGLVIPIFQALVEAIAPVISSILDGLGDAIVTLVGYAQEYWPKFSEIITAVIDMVAPVIQKVIDIIMVLVNDVILPLLPVAWDIFLQLWEKVQPVLESFWDALSTVGDFILDLVNNVVVPNLPLISGAFETLWNVLSPIIGFILGAIDKLIGAFQKVVEWGSKVSGVIGSTISGAGNFIGKVFGGGNSKSHASGIDRIPYDGYQATLHKGERVLTAHESKEYDKGSNGGGGGGVTINMGGVTIKDNGQSPEEIARYIAHRINELT